MILWPTKWFENCKDSRGKNRKSECHYSCSLKLGIKHDLRVARIYFGTKRREAGSCYFYDPTDNFFITFMVFPLLFITFVAFPFSIITFKMRFIFHDNFLIFKIYFIGINTKKIVKKLHAIYLFIVFVINKKK